MRKDRILLALFAVAVSTLAVVEAESHANVERRRGRRKLLGSENSFVYTEFRLPRGLWVNAESHGPKKGKSSGNSGSSYKGEGSGKAGKSDKYGDDDDDEESELHPTWSPTQSPFSPDEPTPPSHKSKGPHPSAKSDKSKKTKKPKTEDSKKNKGSKLEKSTKAPTHEPTDEPVAAPSTDVPTADPAPAPGPSLPPSSANLRVLSPYQLVYTLSEYRVPFRSELLEVVELTRVYLQNYFFNEFEMNDGSQLEEFLTIFLDTAFDFGDPIPIEYESSAIFNPDSDDIPSTNALDDVLESAFEGNNLEGYLGMLQALPAQNLFSKTLLVELTEPSIGDSTSGIPAERGVTTAAAAMAGTTGLLLILTGVLLRRRHAQSEAEDSEDENGSFSGKRTIATATIDSHSSLEQMIVPIVRTFRSIPEGRQYQDEEDDGCDNSVSSMCNPLNSSKRSR